MGGATECTLMWQSHKTCRGVKEKYLAILLGYLFSYLSIKTYVVGIHKKRLGETFRMNTYNICFYVELERIITKLSSHIPP